MFDYKRNIQTLKPTGNGSSSGLGTNFKSKSFRSGLGVVNKFSLNVQLKICKKNWSIKAPASALRNKLDLKQKKTKSPQTYILF